MPPAVNASIRTPVRYAATSFVQHRRERFAFGLFLLVALFIVAIPARAGNSLDVTTVSPGNGQTVTGSTTWQVAVGSGNVGRVDFAIDGTVKWSEQSAPWLYNGITGGLNTSALADGAHELTAKAYSRNGKATGSSTVTVIVSNAPPTAPPPPDPPLSSNLPTISGTPIVGQTLSASTGSWSGAAPTNYSYSWSRCDSTGGGCSPISGATSATYLLASADAGSTIRVSVTATNSGGSATVSSAATAVVQAVPTSTGYPTVSGTPTVGQTLSASPGTWSGSTPMTDTYSWSRCNSTGGSCSPISGATSAGYLLGSGDAGSTIRVGVTATNAAGSATATSAPTAVIATPAQPPTSTALPTISGTTTVGQTLSASTGTWSGSTPMSYAYSWSRCNSTGGSCSPISGATSAGYLLGSADAGSTIRVGVTATNGAGSATATSAATGLVATAAPSAPAAGLGTALPPRLPESSGTQTLVVTPSGSATSSCTLSTPCSFNRAWSLATSGTVIQLRGNAGNYSGNLFISGKSYSSSNPVTMTTYPGDPIATFVGSSTSPEWALHVQGDQGIRLRNFRVSAPTNGGVHIEESWHIDVDRLVSVGNGSGCSSTVVFTSCGAQGILVSGGNPGFFTTYSDDVQIWNSVLANNGGNSTYASVGCCASSTNHDHSLYLGGGPETVEPGFRNAVVADNLIFDSKDGYPVQVGQSARNLIFTNNTIDNTSNSDAACAIVVYGTGTWASSGNLFVNNIISNVAGSGSSAVCASLGKNLTGNHVRNNLAYGVSGTTYDPVYGSYTGFDCVTSCPGQNFPNANPLFVDTVGTYADPTGKDFHLQAGSPALGKADPAYTPPFDMNGSARPAAPAVGALQ
jgi:hypothetical protein